MQRYYVYFEVTMATHWPHDIALLGSQRERESHQYMFIYTRERERERERRMTQLDRHMYVRKSTLTWQVELFETALPFQKAVQRWLFCYHSNWPGLRLLAASCCTRLAIDPSPLSAVSVRFVRQIDRQTDRERNIQRSDLRGIKIIQWRDSKVTR